MRHLRQYQPLPPNPQPLSSRFPQQTQFILPHHERRPCNPPATSWRFECRDASACTVTEKKTDAAIIVPEWPWGMVTHRIVAKTTPASSQMCVQFKCSNLQPPSPIFRFFSHSGTSQTSHGRPLVQGQHGNDHSKPEIPLAWWEKTKEDLLISAPNPSVHSDHVYRVNQNSFIISTDAGQTLDAMVNQSSLKAAAAEGAGTYKTFIICITFPNISKEFGRFPTRGNISCDIR